MRQEGVDDMTLLTKISNDAIAANLKERFDADVIYVCFFFFSFFLFFYLLFFVIVVLFYLFFFFIFLFLPFSFP